MMTQDEIRRLREERALLKAYADAVDRSEAFACYALHLKSRLHRVIDAAEDAIAAHRGGRFEPTQAAIEALERELADCAAALNGRLE